MKHPRLSIKRGIVVFRQKIIFTFLKLPQVCLPLYRFHNCCICQAFDICNLRTVFQDNKLLIVGVTITGGEPFHQPDELYSHIKMLRHLEYEDGYKYEFIKDKFHQIIDCIDVLVDGLYDDSLNDNVGQKGIIEPTMYCAEFKV